MRREERPDADGVQAGSVRYRAVEGRQLVPPSTAARSVGRRPLLLSVTNRAIGLVTRFVTCFDDTHADAQVEPTLKATVAQRVFGLVLRYQDLDATYLPACVLCGPSPTSLHAGRNMASSPPSHGKASHCRRAQA
jgi:hypothetical protein